MDDNPRFYEIFRAGTYPQRNVTKEDIQAIAESFDPEFCEAPISIFHWGNDFAYGWINELKVEGEKLMASFKDVTDELKEYMAKKMLKRHSIELYEDLDGKGLYLKGLAMLGKDTPQVKNMQPLEFKEAESVQYKFEELPSFADDMSVDYYKNVATKAEKKNQRLQTELDQEKTKSQTYASEKEQLQFQQRKEKFESFLDEKTGEGKFPPVLREKSVSLFNHLDNVSQESEEDEESAVELFKQIIGAFKKQIDFGEEFEEGAEEEGELTSKQLSDKISSYQEEQAAKGIKVSTADALEHVKAKLKNQGD